MKFFLCAVILGLVVADSNHEHVTKDIKLAGTAYAGDDPTSWLNDCTQSIKNLGCADCTCTAAKHDGEVVITASGGEEDLDKLEDKIENNGITISGQEYTFVAEEEEESGTVTLVVTMAIFFCMCISTVAFFCCQEWPNTPARIAEREAKRKQEEADKKAAEKTKNALSGSSQSRY